jgi:hypothetical protein
MAIVKVNYIRNARRGETRRVGRAVAYYSWREDGGEHPREAPRTWHSADGRLMDYATARRELTQGTREAAYTYRVVLSTAEVPLTPQEYAAVLNRQFGRWHFVLHHGGAHPHAHVVALSDRRLDRDALRDLREALAQREAEQRRRQALLTALHLDEGVEAEQEPVRLTTERRRWEGLEPCW